LEPSIEFFSEEINFVLEEQTKTRKWINHCIQEEGLILGELNFIFCSDPYLLKVNQEYLHHDFYTDIITFDARVENNISGDIFISIDRVKENAQTHSNHFTNELHRVIIHGVLHIIGYDDKTLEEKTLMRSKEDFYLSLASF
jgi:rRNA maturation RNase YbeY